MIDGEAKCLVLWNQPYMHAHAKGCMYMLVGMFVT
jgi:hypothetical protein